MANVSKGLIFYPGTTKLGVDVFCRMVDGEIVPCEDQEAAKKEWDEAAYWYEQGKEITGQAKIELLKKYTKKLKK